MISKAQEAGIAADDDDANSLASSFVSVGRASPTSSLSSAAADNEDPPPYSPVHLNQPQPSNHVEEHTQSGYPINPQQSQPTRSIDVPEEQSQPVQTLHVPQGPINASWANQDPRSASTESLLPSAPPEDQRRRLLLIYVHGFMGNETSFQGFPAHVHNLLTLLLAESHIVHTKIYPRYHTKKALQLATNELCNWLHPHEDSNTDIVLLGHSMGGLLAADVALAREPVTQLLRHRLLGTISFDTPFLGMHPGVVWSGLSSVFRPQPTPPKTPQSSTVSHPDTFAQTSLSDPHFNPPFANDTHLPVRTAWDNTMHFVNKHSKNLHQATKQLVSAHVEFGSALADGKALKTRYAKIRALDNEAGPERVKALDGMACPKRTRFVNYYTASAGRAKKQKPHRSHEHYDKSTDALPSVPSTEPGSCSALSRPQTTHGGDDVLTSWDPHNLQREDSEVTSMTSRAEASLDTTPRRPTRSVTCNLTTSDLPSTRGLRAPLSVGNLHVHSRSRSPTPSYTTLPSYTTEDRPLSPAPSYPHSNLDSATASSSMLSTHRSPSTVSSGQTAVPSEQSSQPPAPLGPPPVPSDYQDPAAYTQAIKAYMQTAKEYATALKTYHKLQAKQRKAEAYAKIMERKTALVASAEERKLELRQRSEELRRTPRAPTDEIRRLESEVRAEQKAERKAVHKLAKEDRRATRNAMKEERKAVKHAVKEERKAVREAWKSGSGSPCPWKGGLPASAFPDSDDVGPDCENASEVTEVRTLSPTSTMHECQVARGCVPAEDKKRKDKKFCMLPPTDSQGQRDSAWVRVFMPDVDEVGAHTGLFFPQGATGSEAIPDQAWGERYAWLVADVADRIESWANDEMTERLVNGGVHAG